MKVQAIFIKVIENILGDEKNAKQKREVVNVFRRITLIEELFLKSQN